MDPITRNYPTSTLPERLKKDDLRAKRKAQRDLSHPVEGLRRSARLLTKRHCSIPSNQQIDFIESLPAELAIKILSYLKSQDILNCCLVSRSWASIGQHSEIQRPLIYQEVAFGALK